MKAPFVLALAACLFAAPAQALEIRFFPADHLYAYDLSRGDKGLLVHNIAIINDGAAAVALSEVTIDLMDGERALDTRRLGAQELTAAAAAGAGLQQQGLLGLLSFQLGPDLLPANVTLSPDLTLDPGEAVLVTSQALAFNGARDSVRVRVNGDHGEGRIAIRTGVSQTAFSFPLRGTWYNVTGASFHTHHRGAVLGEFGSDFVKLGQDFRTHRRNTERLTNYYAYGEPVLAAADGRVVFVINNEPEDPSILQQPGEDAVAYVTRWGQGSIGRIGRGAPGVAGNQIVIDHGNGEYSFYGHLKTGSVRVAVGDAVTRGQEIAAVGSSGNSTEPHLHFHVCSTPDPLVCPAIPINWQGVSLLSADPITPGRTPQSGDFMVPTAEAPH